MTFFEDTYTVSKELVVLCQWLVQFMRHLLIWHDLVNYTLTIYLFYFILFMSINLWLLDIVHLIINLTVSSCITIVKSCYYSNTQQHSSWYPSQISPPRTIICFGIYFDLWNPKSNISSPFPNPPVLQPPHKPGATHAVANHERCARRGAGAKQEPTGWTRFGFSCAGTALGVASIRKSPGAHGLPLNQLIRYWRNYL